MHSTAEPPGALLVALVCSVLFSAKTVDVLTNLVLYTERRQFYLAHDLQIKAIQEAIGVAAQQVAPASYGSASLV
jgi:hypothetical protein